MAYDGSEVDYLRAMEDLAERGEALRNGAIAQALQISAPSVTQMLGRLQRRSLVKKVGRGEVKLTAKGRREARRSIRRHRLIETWLVETLDFDWVSAHEEAHRLEHALSPRLEKALAEHLGHPSRDPHGAAIPSLDGSDAGDPLTALADLPVGGKGVVRRMSDRDADRLVYWQSLGIALGAAVEKRAVAPYEGPVELRVGRRTVSVGRAALDGLWVEPGKGSHANE